MNADVNFKSIKIKLRKLLKMEARHATFLIIMAILLIYLINVWTIGKLATAEPSLEAQASSESTGRLLRVDEAAIKQIQELEYRNPDIKSLFNEARNNPFRE